LSTLCTPHRGFYLIDQAVAIEKELRELGHTEKAFEVLGLSLRNATEFSTRNMKAFNEVASDDPEVKYTSFGAKRKEL
jgi:hypothetical protein